MTIFRTIVLVGCFSSFLSCKKKCEQVGHYVIANYMDISGNGKLRFGVDSLHVKLTIPFKSLELRAGVELNVQDILFPRLLIMIPTLPRREFTSPPIDAIKDGYFEVVSKTGRRVGNGWPNYEWAKSDTAWEIAFSLVPKRRFDGCFFLRRDVLKYQDDCLLIEPIPVIVNDNRNWSIIQQRLDWRVDPWQNDVFFYVE
jgi:hypothetical protein